AAMAAAYREYQWGDPEDSLKDYPRFRVNWTSDPVAEFDEDDSLTEPVSVILTRDRTLLVEIYIANGPVVRTGTEKWPEGHSILESWLTPRRARLVCLEPHDPENRWLWT